MDARLEFILLFGAVLAAGWAAWETRKTSQAQIVSTLLDAYGSEEMLTAIHQVKAYCDADVNFAKKFVTDINATNANYEGAHKGRRRLAHYFQKIAILSRSGLLDKRLLAEIVSPNQVHFLCSYVEPLDIANTRRIGTSYDSRDYDEVVSIHPDECKARITVDHFNS